MDGSKDENFKMKGKDFSSSTVEDILTVYLQEETIKMEHIDTKGKH